MGVFVFCGLVIVGIAWWYSSACKQADRRKQRYARADRENRRYRLRSRNSKPKSNWFNRAAEEAHQLPGFNRLNGLTRNVETSERMIEYVATRHPEKDQRWCIEKAIYDLERDRMAR